MKKLVIYLITAVFLSFGFSNVTSAAGNTYTVKKGDTLWAISKKHNVTVKQIKSWNKLSSDTIKPKQVLKVTGASTKAAAPKKTAVKAASKKAYKEIKVKATAYTASCKGCSGITYTGINLKKNPNAKVISVDPKVIPLGSKVYVPGYGEAIAGDKGSAVRGNKIDVFIPNKQKALQWGSKTVTIKVYK
ncbi:LysM peptidoglycan-binding domain-containing protein [Cytobacillus firmus]|uniref:LysM peptidoglycan-binding domain-containing protein n=1 Tax=Cytobacillus firmus TaxID=1399 RepID=UPI001C9643D9|nr:LysM peptidoglycan-binding domain-containing protein [Cytobacillus firmus]MBY6052555.1 LysM peptidoglycan-binding domain-containing protein [Cytobacillus firmus]